MFIERVSTLDANMKNKVNTGADIARSADTAYEKDYGKLGSNVEAESWAWEMKWWLFFIIKKNNFIHKILFYK